MKIAVGSKNPAKVSAVLGVYEDAEIISIYESLSWKGVFEWKRTLPKLSRIRQGFIERSWYYSDKG